MASSMIIATAYTRNQRYQLSKLAEQPKLTPSQYETQRSAILDGDEPFGKCPENWVRSSTLMSRNPKADIIQQILELLRDKGEMNTANLAHAFNKTDAYIRDAVLSHMLEQGLVHRRMIARKQGQKTFLWSLP